MNALTFAYLLSPVHLHCIVGTFLFFLFSFFYFLFYFLRAHKKHKNANKRISDFIPLRCFLSAFFIFVRLFAFLCFCLVAFLCSLCSLCFLRFLCFCCFWFFWCFWCVQNLFVKKIKSLKLP